MLLIKNILEEAIKRLKCEEVGDIERAFNLAHAELLQLIVDKIDAEFSEIDADQAGLLEIEADFGASMEDYK